MPYKDDIWDWSGTDVKVVNATVVLEGVSVVTAEPSENAIEPLERADVELLLPIQIISREETPTVTHLQIIDYESSSIECAFDVATEQAEEVVKGVLCGTTNPPTFENADYRLLHGQGSMDLVFAGLHQNTEYYLRPYALSNFGYKYGDVVAQRTKASPIPDEYQLVEYLESNGQQFINTNLVLGGDSYRHIELMYFTSQSWLFGQFAGANNADYVNQTNSTLVQLSYDGQNINIPLIITYNKIIIERNAEKVTVGDYSHSFTNVIYQNAYPDYLFALGGSHIRYFGNGRIYHYKASISGNTTNMDRDMYSVYRKADNKPGMYDIVNNQFYTNQGTGEFEVGPDKEWEE